MKTIAFFGNKAGVGTSLVVYHLGWMYAKLGHDVLVVDMDPQAGLTEYFLDENRLEQLWGNGDGRTVYDAVLEASGPGARVDSARPSFEDIADGLALLPGDLALAGAEDDLAVHWQECRDGRPEALRATAASYLAVRRAARQANASLIIIDAGSNLGAVARAAMLAADDIVVTVAPGPASLRGLANFGLVLRRWHREWQDHLSCAPDSMESADLPVGTLNAAGYVVWQRSLRLDRPIMRRLPWLQRIPGDFRRHVLDDDSDVGLWVDDDPYCIGNLTYYLGLMPLAHDAKKPVFDLKPGDGLIGDHMPVVFDRYREYRDVALRLGERCGMPVVTDRAVPAPPGARAAADASPASAAAARPPASSAESSGD